MRDRILYTTILGFVCGVFIHSLFPVSLSSVYLLLLLSFATLLYYFLITQQQKIFLLIALFLFTSAVGVWRFDISARNIGDLELNESIGQKVTLRGVVDDEPDVREHNTKLTVHVVSINDNNREIPVDSKMIVTVDSYPKYEYGDTISISGTLKRPENFISSGADGEPNPNGRMFDYVSYLRKDGIFYVMQNAVVERTGENQGWWIRRKLFDFKKSILSKIELEIPAPESALMGGLILGTKQSLGDQLRQDFIRTGTIHIVALSGYNVTIVAEAVMRALGVFLARTAAIYFGIAGIVLFAIMTGAGSTVVRASVMVILALIARATGRNYDIGRALLIAGFAMVLINPWILVFDISFQLSFLATIGLIYLTPKVKPWFHFVTEKFGLQEIVSATVATNIFVLPFILYKMGILSIVALPVNLLVLPFIPYTMLFGFITSAISFVFHFLALPFGIISYAFLHYELSVIQLFSRLPFAAVTVGFFPLVLVMVIYSFYVWWILKLKE